MLAQQKISNLSEDLKIALRRGGHGGGRVGRVKVVGRGLVFFFFYDGKSKCQEKKEEKKRRCGGAAGREWTDKGHKVLNCPLS